MPNILTSSFNFRSRSLKDLLDARDQYQYQGRMDPREFPSSQVVLALRPRQGAQMGVLPDTNAVLCQRMLLTNAIHASPSGSPRSLPALRGHNH